MRTLIQTISTGNVVDGEYQELTRHEIKVSSADRLHLLDRRAKQGVHPNDQGELVQERELPDPEYKTVWVIRETVSWRDADIRDLL